VAAGSFKQNEPPRIRGNGYVVETLEAALWAFFRSTSFDEGALKAANLGHDADTTAALYGQLAGAFYGIKEILWRHKVARQDLIESLATRLCDQAVPRRDANWLGSNLAPPECS
jgi:ADP-ribosylglycohydrolase